MVDSGGSHLQARSDSKYSASLASSAPGSLFDAIFDSWFLLRSHWRLIVLATLAAFFWVFLFTKFVLTKWYQATALLRPTPPQSEANQMVSIASQMLGGGIGGILSAAGLDTQTQDEAELDMSILQSYSFTMDLLKNHHLKERIVQESRPFWKSDGMTDWAIFQAVQHRFDCNFDIETGNVTLTFLAPDPGEAERVLTLYIDDLRAILRARQVRTASLAIESLKYQAEHTSDSVLQANLYQLLAQQLQRQQLAEVQADFAFNVIDPPIVPDRAYRPRVMLSSAIAAVLVLFVSVGAIILYDRVLIAWSEYEGRATRQDAIEPDEAAADSSSRSLPRRQRV